MSRNIDLNDVRLLMQVIEYGSYSAASRAIGVPKSTISQRIATLERTVGTGLLRRTSRSFSLTEAGSLLLPHARAIEELARRVEHALMDQSRDLSGTLRISSSNALAQFTIAPLVPRFLAKHEHVTIRVEATNRLVDLVGEGYDMLIRGHIGPLKNSTLLQRVVARAPWSIVASPEWIENNGRPDTLDALRIGKLLCFSTGSDCPNWTLSRGTETIVVEVMPHLISDDMAALRASAIAGGGITCLPTYVVAPAIRDGALCALLTDWSSPASDISVLTPPRAQSSRLASAFSKFLAAEMPRAMRQMSTHEPETIAA